MHSSLLKILFFPLFLSLACTLFISVNVQAEQHLQHVTPEHVMPEDSADHSAHAPSANFAAAVSSTYATNGRLWLAWVMGNHVYVNYSDDDGITMSEAVMVNQEAHNIAVRGESRLKIAVAPNGNLYIAYTEKLAKPYTGNIRFSRSTDDGLHFSTPITVNSDTRIISHRFESMAVNKNGHIYLAWLDGRDAAMAQERQQTYKGAALYYAVSTDYGASFQRNIKIQDNSCQCCRIAMDTDSKGLPVIVWRQIFSGKIRNHAVVRLTATNNGAELMIDKIHRLANDNWIIDTCPHHGPALSIGADDTYQFTWFTDAPQRQGLHYSYSSDHGKNFNADLHFGKAEHQAQHPDVYSYGDKVFIVWQTFDGNQSALMVLRSNNRGKNWGEARTLATASGPTDYPFFLPKPGNTRTEAGQFDQQLKVAWLSREKGFQLINIPSTTP